MHIKAYNLYVAICYLLYLWTRKGIIYIRDSNMFSIRFAFIVVLLTVSQLCLGGNSVKKAMTEVNKGHYGKAKILLVKALKTTPDDYALHYTFALYYFRGDNKVQKLDSAYYYATRSIDLYPKGENTTTMENYAGLGIRPYTMSLLLSQINARAYGIADSLDTAGAWDHFIKHHSKSKQIQTAVNRRNDLAFKAIKESGDFKSFKEFMDKYPNASQIPEAKQLYENLLYKKQTKGSTSAAYLAFMQNYPESPYYNKALVGYELALYEEATADGELEAYYNFTKKYPDSPHRRKAEDKIYQLYISGKTMAEYSSFVLEFPGNRNAKKAWLILYEMYNANRSWSLLTQFKSVYPQFPYKDMLRKDLKLAQLELSLFSEDDLFGYKDDVTDETVITPHYTDAYPFSGGLAAVTTDECDEICRYGYIDKSGQLVIPVEFSEANMFIDGLAMVALGSCFEDTCKWGFINRKGTPVLPYRV